MINTIIINVVIGILGKLIKDAAKSVKYETYKNRLIQIVEHTIEEFENKFPYDINESMFPFYHSQILFEKLTSYVFFNGVTEDDIKNELNNNQNIIKPTDEELDEFYQLFNKNIQNDNILKDLFINENYKTQIFTNTNLLKKILNEVKGNAFNQFPKCLTNNIPKLSEDEIVGRGKILKELYEMLFDKQPVVVVNGIGGIGKTTIAQVYVENNYTKYKHIIWLNQIEGNNIYTQFASARVLRKNLNIADSFANSNDTFNEIIRRLNKINSGPNLLIIDNADGSVEEIRNFLPDTEKWHTLITSRIYLNGFTAKYLDFLSKKKAYNLLIKYYRKDGLDKSQIFALIKSLDYHTLSIEILSKTANQIDYDFDELLNVLKNNAEINLYDIRHSKKKRLEKIHNYLAEIFKLSNLSDEELTLLKQLSILPNHFISYLTIQELIIEKSNKKIKLMLDRLYKKGWLLKDRNSNSFKMHLIIAEVVKKQANINFDDISYYIKQVTDKLSIDQTKDNPVDKFQWIDYGKVILKSLKSQSKIWDKKESTISLLQNNLATVLKALGDYEGAKSLLEEAYSIFIAIFGEWHNHTKIVKENLNILNKLIKKGE